MIAFEQELTENPAHVVLVVDDLTATMSCAIVAKKQGIKVAHLVAGTRSFDMKMPKEVNRMITDGISDYLFTAGMVANRNLNQTGTESENVYYVGNTGTDCLSRYGSLFWDFRKAITSCSPSTDAYYSTTKRICDN